MTDDLRIEAELRLEAAAHLLAAGVLGQVDKNAAALGALAHVEHVLRQIAAGTPAR